MAWPFYLNAFVAYILSSRILQPEENTDPSTSVVNGRPYDVYPRYQEVS